MNARSLALVATTGLLAVGAFAPATAAGKTKPISMEYDVQGLPNPQPLPSGTSCLDDQYEGISRTTKVIKTTGPGVLSVTLNGFSGDWDITLMDKDGEELAIGDGTSTGGGAPATAGEDTLVTKLKKPGTFQVAVCNFLGSPQAHVKLSYKEVRRHPPGGSAAASPTSGHPRRSSRAAPCGASRAASIRP
jgi:hypothetical protein